MVEKANQGSGCGIIVCVVEKAAEASGCGYVWLINYDKRYRDLDMASFWVGLNAWINGSPSILAGKEAGGTEFFWGKTAAF